MSEVLIHSTVQRIMQTYPNLKNLAAYNGDMLQFTSEWMNTIRMGVQGNFYAEVTRPIEEAFKFRCMRDAMAADKLFPPPASETCDIKRNMRMHTDYTTRLNRRVSDDPTPQCPDSEKTYNVNTRIRGAIDPLRTPVLQMLIVEFLSMLPTLNKMKRKPMLQFVDDIQNAITNPPYIQHGSGAQWPDGLWTPVIMAIFEHKRFKYRYHMEGPDEYGPRRHLYVAITHFPVEVIKEIARIDSVEKLKQWLARHDGTFVSADNQSCYEVAIDWVMQLNATRCYKYMCCMHVPEDHNFCGRRIREFTDEHVNAQPQTISFDAPPLQPKMLRLMYGQCGKKEPQDPPPRAGTHSTQFVRDRRRAWVREYLWQLVRWRVRVAKYAWHWIEEHEMRKYKAVFDEDGGGLMLGESAVDGLDHMAKSNGLKVQDRGDRSADAEIAMVDAEMRAARYRFAEREVRMDSDDDDDKPLTKKPRRTYGDLLAALQGPREESGEADELPYNPHDSHRRRESQAEQDRREMEEERERCRIEEALILDAEEEDEVQAQIEADMDMNWNEPLVVD